MIIGWEKLIFMHERILGGIACLNHGECSRSIRGHIGKNLSFFYLFVEFICSLRIFDEKMIQKQDVFNHFIDIDYPYY